MKFNFIDDVWTDQGGRRLTVELSENGGHVRMVLHAMENGPVAELTLANYRMRRIWEGLEKAWGTKPGDKTSVALERLVRACYPIDMWMGGTWGKPPTDAERHEFVLALSAAMSLVPPGDTTSASQQTPAVPDDSAPSARTESEDPGSC